MESTRPTEIEAYSNRLLVHPFAAALLPRAVALGIHPNAVSCAGLGFGLLAALSYSNWRDWRFALAGLVLMLCWHTMDGLDGKLARATGKCSAFGRLLDGVADYSTYVAVYIVLAITSPRPGPALLAALVAGACHALQAQFYEGERTTYIRRLRGNYQAVQRSNAGGCVERLYNRGEALLGNHARTIDAVLRASPAAKQDQILRRWRPRAVRVFRLIMPLSSNSRTFTICVACLLGNPIYYWLWEIGPLTVMALAGAYAFRQAEARAIGSPLGELANQP